MSAEINSEETEALQKISEAHTLLSKDQRDAAFDLYDEIILTTKSLSINSMEQLALLAFKLNQSAKAIELFSELYNLNPENIRRTTQLAAVYLETGRYDEAYHFYSQALKLDHENVESLVCLGIIFSHKKLYEKAIDCLEQARKTTPNHPTLLKTLSIAYNSTGQPDKAEEIIQRLVKTNPKMPDVNSIQAMISLQKGEPKRAEKFYKKELSINPFIGHCYTGIATSHKATKDDQGFIDSMESILKQQAPLSTKGFIHFALGKMYDDLELFDKAFSHFSTGNTLLKPFLTPELDIKVIKMFGDLYKNFIKKNQVHPDSQIRKPIFIIGMPRSGSTLTEQIIKTRPNVISCGESRAMYHVVMETPLFSNQKISAKAAFLTNNAVKLMTQSYRTSLGLHNLDDLRITDKQLANFHYLGLILLLFPDAKIIHCKRNPLDTLLSCYFQPFADVSWTNSFDTLASTYKNYRNIMSYWEKLIPQSNIIEVAYEDLVENPVVQSQRIMAFCEMTWSEDCLQFQNQKSSVRTASTWQVRQAIYKTSRMRWPNYAQQITPLANNLITYLSDEDIKIFEDKGITLRKKTFWNSWNS